MAITPDQNSMLNEFNGLIDNDNLAPGFKKGQILTELPDTSNIGEEIYLKAAENMYWHMLFTDEDEKFPWNYLGGPLLSNRTSSVTTSSSAYQTTNSPFITCSFSGVYNFYFGAASVTQNAVGDGSYVRTGLHRNGSFLGETISRTNFNGASPASHFGEAESKEFIKNEVGQVRYKVDGGVVAHTFYSIYIKVEPLRIG
jgi:hypothetical protein